MEKKPKIVLSLRIPHELHGFLTDFAKRRGVSFNSLLTNVLFDFYDSNWRRPSNLYPVASPVATEKPKAIVPEKTKFPAIGRNDPCPCGSGRKWKTCCKP